MGAGGDLRENSAGRRPGNVSEAPLGLCHLALTVGTSEQMVVVLRSEAALEASHHGERPADKDLDAGMRMASTMRESRRTPQRKHREEQSTRMFLMIHLTCGRSSSSERPMDTPSWSTTSLPPLVAMVLQEPSCVHLPAGRSDVGAAGSARWPLAPVGPAQTILSALRHAAQALGYVVPETFCAQAGQIFYHN